MIAKELRALYSTEFKSYSSSKFLRDLFAGLTVAAVALPLALAFGVVSGSTAEAGLITAIVSGILIGALSGAPYQISGPTGAMSAVLIVLSQRYGLEGIWLAGFFSGLVMLLLGVLRLGRFIAFIPAPVITGFTSGIAVIIAVGQLDNLFGVPSPPVESFALKLLGYFQSLPAVHWPTLLLGVSGIFAMIVWPKSWALRFPASLAVIIGATFVSEQFQLQIATIGEIPRTIFLEHHLVLSQITWADFTNLLVPIFSISALGAIESLLCGAVASNMTGIRLRSNQELVAQGIGNIVLPFLGGVPATAAIARTSVGIRAGGVTRLVSIFHGLGLLLFMFVCAGFISKIPMASLAAVLIVTAWRMNEWEAIRFYFSKRMGTAIGKYLITLVATVTLDLTYAIVIGFVFAAALFLNRASQIEIDIHPVDKERLAKSGISIESSGEAIKVAYVTGPLFFAAVGHFIEAFSNLGDTKVLILSVRGMPSVDSSGLKAIHHLADRMKSLGGSLLFAGAHPKVIQSLELADIFALTWKPGSYWSSDQAIVAANKMLILNQR